MYKLKIFFLIFLFLFSPLAVFAQVESTPESADTQICVIPVYLFATQEGGALAITPVAESQYLYSYATDSENVETGLINSTGTVSADQASTELGNQPVIPMGLLLVAVGSDPDAVNSFLETGEGVGQRIFTGHEYDSDSNGLTYMGARYYSGEAGKLISQDPLFQLVGDKNFKVIAGYDQREYLANPQNSNSYSYAGNNPLKYVDPFGLDYYFNSSGQLVKDTGSGSKSYFENDDVKMLNQNASYMEQNKLNYAKFYDKVKTGGDWDYKQSERGFYFFKGELVDKYSFGNLNYGYTGTAGGFSKGLLTDMGGFVHIKNNTLESLSGNSVMANYDAPDDRSNVIKGVNSYFSSHNNLSTVTAKLQQLQYNLLGFPIAARMLGTAYCGLKSVPFLIKNSKW